MTPFTKAASALQIVLFSILPVATALALPKSWVEDPPDEVNEAKFTPSPFEPIASLGEDGRLVYKPFSEKGDKLLDWSYCGYMQSTVPIPDVPVIETLFPIAGDLRKGSSMAYPSGPDSRKRIQDALNAVGKLEPDENGIRGAVLLKRGIYFIDGALRVGSGVVLRGEGDAYGGTIIIANNKNDEEAMVILGNSSGKILREEGSPARVKDEYVPTGSMQLTLERAGQFKAGDYINIKKTVNDQWIEDLGMGQRLQHIRGGEEGANKRPWKASSYQFSHIRQVKAVEGNTITLDAMMPQSLAKEHGGGEVYLATLDGIATQAGVESICFVSNYNKSESSNDKDAQYENFRSGISVRGAQDCWVKGCSVYHISYAAVITHDHTRQITIRDSKYMKPVGPVRGGFRYAFNAGGGTQHLFYNCYSEDGRHCFVGGSRTMGPYAFVFCTSVRGGQSEPHHRWGTGYLFDNVVTKDGSLAAINRGDSGTGHGWAASNTLFWNCDAKNIVVFDPETTGESNFAIGYRGAEENIDTRGLHYANTRSGYWGTPREGKFFGFALMGNGHIESPDQVVDPQSLFVQQLVDRIGKEQAYEVLKEK